MSTNWCKDIKNDTRLNKLALPGTHDAAAWTHHSSWPLSTPGTWAQRKSITEQLDLGVRVLDLRVGYASNNLTLGSTSFVGMFHGPVYLSVTLDEVLKEVNSWLSAHDQEFVILIFQQQGKPGQRDVKDAVMQQTQKVFGERRIYTPDANMTEWPTVQDIRGKVLMFNRMRSQANNDAFFDVRSWLEEGDNTTGTMFNNIQSGLSIYLQDRYKGLSSEEGYQSMEDDNKKKFEYVVTAAAHIQGRDGDHLGINHMSYSNLRYQPWASGKGVNTLFHSSNLSIKGILMIDDANQTTVERIISNNAAHYKN